MRSLTFARKVLYLRFSNSVNSCRCIQTSHRITGKSINDTLRQGPKENVTVQGWVKAVRKHREIAFLHISDGTTVKPLQLVVSPEEICSETKYGCSLEATGELRTSAGSGQDLELNAHKLAVVGKCDTQEFPLKAKKHHPADYLRQYPHLRPRASSFTSLLRVRNAATQAMHQYFQDNGFCQIHTPILTTNDCEGAGEIFQVQPSHEAIAAAKHKESMRDYFSSPAYLTVSGQLHLEAVAGAMRNVYTFGPTFRAENSRGRHHLCEFYMVEGEMSFTKSLGDIMSVIQGLVQYTTQAVCDDLPEDLARITSDTENHQNNIKNLTKKEYCRLSYSEAVEILQKYKDDFKFPLKWGNDLQKEHERQLVHHCGGTPVFVTDFPRELKAFYAKRNEDDATVGAVDLLCSGVGEVCGGSLREDQIDILQTVMESMNVAKKYDWYLDLRRYGSVPHGGFGLGFERYLQTLLGISNIKDTIPFPRSVHNCKL